MRFLGDLWGCLLELVLDGSLGWVVLDLGPSFLAAEREAGVHFLAQLLSTSETFIRNLASASGSA